MKDQSCFRIGCFIVIGETFTVKVVDKGSLVLEEPLPRGFLPGTHVRQLSQNEPLLSIENGFDHRTVKTSTSEELSSDSGGGVACLFENESDPAHGAPERVRGDGIARTTLQIPVFIGQRKLRVRSYEGFSRHDIIILGEKFLAFIADFGSIVLDRPVDQNFPQGTELRGLSPQDLVTQDLEGNALVNNMRVEPLVFNNQGPEQTVQQQAKQFQEIERKIPPPPREARVPPSTYTSKLYEWVLRGQSAFVKAHWKDCSDYYSEHKPTVSFLDGGRVLKPTTVAAVLSTLKTLPSAEGGVVKVINSVQRFEMSFIRAMKGLSPSCSLFAKLMLHGVYEYLYILNSKKTGIEKEELCFQGLPQEEELSESLESSVCTWLAEMLPDNIVRKAQNRSANPSARVMLMEFYFSIIPSDDQQGSELSDYVRDPKADASTSAEVLTNIDWWKTSIQLQWEVMGVMPSLPDMRKAFAKLLRPLMGDEDFVFRRKVATYDLLNARHVSDEDTLEYFKRMVDKIHLIDPLKPLSLDEIDSSNAFCWEFEGLNFSEESDEQEASYLEEANLQENCEPELQVTYDWEGDEAYLEAEAYQDEFEEEIWEQGDEAYLKAGSLPRRI